MRYVPFSSVTTVRTFSMSAGLAASTVTPGSTAPVVSLTSPARAACAAATRGTTATSPNNSKHLASVRMVTSWRLVASLPYEPNDGTYQRQSRLLSRGTEHVFDNSACGSDASRGGVCCVERKKQERELPRALPRRNPVVSHCSGG